MNNNRRQVYVDNYNLLTNLEIALSIPNIEPLESDNDYDILENFEECAMIISELIHIIKRSTYIESFVYNELKKLSGKVYNECVPFAREYMERLNYTISKQEIELETKKKYNDKKSEILSLEHFLDNNKKMLRTCDRFLTHKKGYLTAILNIISSNDYLIQSSSLAMDILDQLYKMIPSFKKDIRDIKTAYRLKYMVLVGLGIVKG